MDMSTIDEANRTTATQRGDEMREDAWAADRVGRDHVVDAAADEVERPEDRVLELAGHTIRVEEALEERLAGGVDPPLLVDGADDEVGAIFGIRAFTRGLSVHLGRRVLNEALAVRHTPLRDVEILKKVELEHLERRRDVEARIRVGDQVHHEVGI